MSTENKQGRGLVRSDSFKKVKEDYHKQVHDIKLKDFILTNLNDLFVENLPSETVKELPTRCNINIYIIYEIKHIVVLISIYAYVI